MGVVTRAPQSDDGELPPRGGSEAGGPDLISLLPDEVLGSVISLLPTEEGARTQILSSRWRPLWRTAPLNLEASGIRGRGITKAVISRILSEHQGIARCFEVTSPFLDYDSAALDGWLRSPALDHLQELFFCFNHPTASPSSLVPHSALRFSSTLRVAKFYCCQFSDDTAHQLHFPNLQHLILLCVTISEDSLHAMLAGCPVLDKFELEYGHVYSHSPIPLMPPSALSFSSTLRFATFGRCQFPDTAAHQVYFPNLQDLELETVTISEGSLHAMLSGCPALNSLQLISCSGFRQFLINSQKLKDLAISFVCTDPNIFNTKIMLQELIVVNAPCLERLHHDAPYKDNTTISIISTLDNLQELEFCFNFLVLLSPLVPHSTLSFSSTLRVAKFIRCQFPDDTAHQLHFSNLQHLVLISVTISEDSLHDMLAGCPVLDKFELKYDYVDSPRPLMPPSALSFSSTLRFATFGPCQFPDTAAHQVYFPNLQHLELETVTISEDSLHAVLSGCPALNSLRLFSCFGFRQFLINSQKLERVEMYFGRSDIEIRLEDLILVNAPCLERLHHHGPYEDILDMMRISIISAPKLKILGHITESSFRLKLGTTVVNGLHDVRVATVMRTVKVLSLGLDKLDLDFIINFMKCFPCMEKLYIKTKLIDTEDMWLHNSNGHLECLDFHLKKIWVSYYHGTRSHVEFAKFFVLNARVLESMVLDVDCVKKGDDWWIENQRRQLELWKRASIGAEIEFTFDDYFNYPRDIQEFSDLSE